MVGGGLETVDGYRNVGKHRWWKKHHDWPAVQRLITLTLYKRAVNAGRRSYAFLFLVVSLLAPSGASAGDFANRTALSESYCSTAADSAPAFKQVTQLAQTDAGCPDPPICGPDERACDIHIDENGCITWSCCPK